MIYARALGDALHRALSEDERVVVLGEDIADPYGGAFKVTRGLSTAFPERVRTTPISEAAIAGVAAGLALAGYRPVAEVMFGDFLALCFDQILNHIAKYEAMYDGSVTCPVVIRTPSGGGRGYGPTHSQSIEKHVFGIPHLRVASASLVHDPDEVMRLLLSESTPTIHVEHKLLYALDVIEAGDLVGATVERSGSGGALSTVAIRSAPRSECRATVVAYGFQAELARRVQMRLALEEEVFVELLIAGQLAPLDLDPILASAGATGSLVTVEEGAAGWSWGTEIAAEAGRRLFGELRRPIDVVASEADVIPSARQREGEVIVGEERIEAAIRAAAT
ncbi:MAG: transketolase C-terminal domain-containing protein [Solirubrobacteraceae bacterium]|jgi:pyruvate/2-oxoglutarate/acetoin dehydrogenase E1 component